MGYFPDTPTLPAHLMLRAGMVMAYELEVINEVGYLHVVYRGRLDVEDCLAIIQESARSCSSRNLSGLLLEQHPDTTGSVSTWDALQIADCAAPGTFPAGTSVALLLPDASQRAEKAASRRAGQ